MFEGRMFEDPHESVEDFEYSHEDSEAVFHSPFPVFALTLDNRVIGAGRVIGKVEVEDTVLPILEIDDEAAPTGVVHFWGTECIWAVATEELINGYVELEGYIDIGAYEYSQELDRRYEAMQN